MSDQAIYRHTLTVRITHWVNVLCLNVLLMSGLQMFNAHPALYIGKQSDFDHPILSITAVERNARLVGVTKLAGTNFTTTGILGVSKVAGAHTPRAFPSWATLPAGQDLAIARRWHFLFAWFFVVNGLTYLVYALTSGHVCQDLLPSRPVLKHTGQSLLNHVRLRFPRGEEATIQCCATADIPRCHQTVLLSGEAGIGKSRLSVTLLERISGEAHTRLRYFCSALHVDSALYPVIGQMERAAAL